MQIWQECIDSVHTRESANQSGILATTSANVQHFNGDAKGLRNAVKHVLGTSTAVSDPQAPPPAPLTIVKSNDKQSLRNKLASREARRSSHSKHRLGHQRSWLRNPKYLNYRERKRFDVGKDNKPIWPDFVEESFQNAMVHIPPMGKNKKTQHGKPYGRNELIAEWIKQDTGVVRTRKQVSSHIQVLSGIFRGDADWKALTKYDGHITPDTMDFWSGSIAEQVRAQRELSAQANFEQEGGWSWNDALSKLIAVSMLCFSMWAGSADQVPKAIHDYTRLASEVCSSKLVPLESLKHWRSQFPHLENILHNSSDEAFDLILINSKMSLMSDFPPPKSKLGLILDIDFRNIERDNSLLLSSLKGWSAGSRYYHRGMLIRQTALKPCTSEQPGQVKLNFEAEWWVTQFINLLTRKKEAENSIGDLALATAEEDARSFLRELTIMQEVFASPLEAEYTSAPRKRMAILLWTFGQASKGHAGVTTWHKVALPANQFSTNSATPEQLETALPLLNMDGAMDESFEVDITDPNLAQHDAFTVMPVSPRITEVSAFHSGFTPVQTNAADALRFFDFASGTGLTPKQGSLTTVNDQHFDCVARTRSALAAFQTIPYNIMPEPVPAAFQLRSNDTSLHHTGNFPVTQSFATEQIVPTSPADRQQSLANFDMTTHQMLQAQLGSDVEPQEQGQTPSSPDQPPSDSQRSMIGHITGLDLEDDNVSHTVSAAISSATEVVIGHKTAHEQAAIEHHSIFDSPKVTRPPLMAHSSFAGTIDTRSVGIDAEPLCFDTPTRNEFDRLIEGQYQQTSPGDLFGEHAHSMVDQIQFPTDCTRPRSQPALPINEPDSLHLGIFLSQEKENMSNAEGKVEEA